MQHTQFRVVYIRLVFPILALILGLAHGALAAGIVHESRPDPLLDDTPDGPCAALTQGPDYAAGTDAQGYPVVPPDVGAPPIAIPDQIAVPLHMGQAQTGGKPGHGQSGHGQSEQGQNWQGRGDSAYATIDGRRLAPLLNPPACGRQR